MLFSIVREFLSIVFKELKKKKKGNQNNLAEYCITFEFFHKQNLNAEFRHFCWPKIINTIFFYQPTLAQSKRYPVSYLKSWCMGKKGRYMGREFSVGTNRGSYKSSNHIQDRLEQYKLSKFS